MTHLSDSLLVVVLLLDFFVLGCSRLRAVIHATALQGVLLALLTLLLHGHWSTYVLVIATSALVVKGLVIPILLLRAIRDVGIRREVEPLIGFTASLLLGACGTGLALLLSRHLPLIDAHAGSPLVPVAFATVFSGLLVLTTRLKAITLVVGYMILDNGVFVFGLLLLDAMPFLVELGMLLDLLVGVFVMGLVMDRIQRTFSTLDTARISTLRE